MPRPGAKDYQLIKRFEDRIEGFNRRSLSFEDLQSICEHNDIEVVLEEMKEAHGVALWIGDQAFIYINRLLNESMRVFNLGHEFTHITDQVIDTQMFLSTGKLWLKSKQERQANIIGAICLMPDCEIEGLTVDQISTAYGIPIKLAEFRCGLLRD